MIVKCKLDKQHLKWHNDIKEWRSIERPVLKYVYDEKHIECISIDENEVWVLEENGAVCCELRNSDDLYIMYIQKHPRFGIGVVASIKNEAGEWKDVYMVYSEKKFNIVTNAR